MEKELWADVPGTDRYQISNRGRVMLKEGVDVKWPWGHMIQINSSGGCVVQMNGRNTYINARKLAAQLFGE